MQNKLRGIGREPTDSPGCPVPRSCKQLFHTHPVMSTGQSRNAHRTAAPVHEGENERDRQGSITNEYIQSSLVLHQRVESCKY